MTVREWDSIYKRQQWGRWPDTRFVEWCMRTFGGANEREREHIRFLELGCGAGAQLRFLQDEGFQAYGVDGSSAALNQAKRNLRDLDGPRPVLWQADLTSFEVPAHAVLEETTMVSPVGPGDVPEFGDVQRLDMGGFDCILDVCTLQHIPPPANAQLIQRARRWLKPGGWIFSKWVAHRHDRPLVPINPAMPKAYLMQYHDIERVFPGFELTADEEIVTKFGPPVEERRHWVITGRKA